MQGRLPTVPDGRTIRWTGKCESGLNPVLGHFQVAVEEQDREKTAVMIPFGLSEWTHMSLGLCSEPTMFQRLMKGALGDYIMDLLLMYLDNIIVFSRDFKSHMEEKLDSVFTCLKEHGLKLTSS